MRKRGMPLTTLLPPRTLWPPECRSKAFLCRVCLKARLPFRGAAIRTSIGSPMLRRARRLWQCRFFRRGRPLPVPPALVQSCHLPKGMKHLSVIPPLPVLKQPIHGREAGTTGHQSPTWTRCKFSCNADRGCSERNADINAEPARAGFATRVAVPVLPARHLSLPARALRQSAMLINT
jgi:hypothetical protein